ncbi:MAG: hypothetical protein QXF82_03070 [Nitrososphaeria archaeon]
MNPRIYTPREKEVIYKAISGEHLSPKDLNLLWLIYHRTNRFNDAIREDVKLMDTLLYITEEKFLWMIMSKLPKEAFSEFLRLWAGLYQNYVSKGRYSKDWIELVDKIKGWISKRYPESAKILR